MYLIYYGNFRNQGEIVSLNQARELSGTIERKVTAISS